MALIQRGFLTGSGSHAPDYVKNGNFVLNRDSPQAQDLVAWWPSVLSNELVDLSGNNHNAALTSVTLQPSEFGNRVAQYDGTNSFAQVPAGAGSVFDWGQGLFTITCWIDAFSANGEGTELIFVADSSNDKFNLFISDVTNSLRFNTRTPGLVNCDSGFDPRGVGPTHVACVRDGLKSGRIVINGTIEATDSHAEANSFLNLTSDLFFGQDVDTSARFEGQILDIRFYDRALTNAEIFSQVHPATHWDLSYETGRVSYFFVPAAAEVAAAGPILQFDPKWHTRYVVG